MQGPFGSLVTCNGRVSPRVGDLCVEMMVQVHMRLLAAWFTTKETNNRSNVNLYQILSRRKVMKPCAWTKPARLFLY